jgi:hypothetical protein
VLKSARGHARINRIAWLLYHRSTALCLDHGEARGAIIPIAGEENADYPGSALQGSGPKQGVDRWAMVVLAGADGHAYATVLDH